MNSVSCVVGRHLRFGFARTNQSKFGVVFLARRKKGDVEEEDKNTNSLPKLVWQLEQSVRHSSFTIQTLARICTTVGDEQLPKHQLPTQEGQFISHFRSESKSLALAFCSLPFIGSESRSLRDIYAVRSIRSLHFFV